MKKLLASVFALVLTTSSVFALDMMVPNGGNSNFQNIMNYSMEKTEYMDMTTKNTPSANVINDQTNSSAVQNENIEIVPDGKKGFLFFRRNDD